jgi:hypothetical protein
MINGFLARIEGLELVGDEDYGEAAEARVESGIAAREEPMTDRERRRLTDVIVDACLRTPPSIAVKLPWEEGVLSQVFGESDGLPEIPQPCLEAIEVTEETRSAPKQPSSSASGRGGGSRGVFLDVIDFSMTLSEPQRTG